MSNPLVNSSLVLLAVLLASIVFFHPRLVAWPKWRATVTPLASIIGSGFLVIGPILLRHFGRFAVLIMSALCLLSYAVGAAIRFNMRSIAQSKSAVKWNGLNDLFENVASWSLVFAYLVSVCYYLNLFGAFAVSLTSADSVLEGKLVTTGVLIFVGVLGWSRGLRGLERAEELSVAAKLAVIGGLLVGMAALTVEKWWGDAIVDNAVHLQDNSWRVAMGLLITVQGFETSRYLGKAYDANVRVQTMQWAQWIASGIYVLYIGLAGMVFSAASIGTRETAIIQITQQVAPILPALLVAAALAAQFSAAVADTNGCGGLAEEVSRGKLRSRMAYVLLVTFGIALTWVANIYEIISYASRVFAVYYAVQCLQATILSWRASGASARTVAFGALALVCGAISVLGISSE